MKTITIPPSKSQAHRILIAASLTNKKIKVKCNILNDDIITTMNALNSIGANIVYNTNGYFEIEPIKTVIKNKIINCNESGSTLRFLISVFSALETNSTFIGKGKLPIRPMDIIYNLLKEHNVSIIKESNDYLPIKIKNKLTSGTYILDGNISSQYLTGLLFALPLLDGDSKIIIENNLISKSYIDITLDILRLSGISFTIIDNVFYIKGNQQYNFPEYYEIEGDWSSAAFWVVSGIIGKEPIKIEGLNINSFQGDKYIINILKKCGANIDIENNYIISYPSKLNGCIIDCSNIPDLVPIISVALSQANDFSILKNIERLKYKESNRLLATKELLNNININCEINGNDFIIKPNELFYNNKIYINTYNDHRIAMSAYIMALLIDKNIDIKYSNIKCISKSYTNFIKEYNRIYE